MNDTLTARLDQLIALFNSRGLDLPDGLFDRRTQFALNGTPFEALLGRSPDDPLVLMLARGAAGYRFMLKALQHAVPDAAIQRGEPAGAGDPAVVSVRVWLSGHLRETREPVDTVISLSARVAPGGSVQTAEATLDPVVLDKLREARLRP